MNPTIQSWRGLQALLWCAVVAGVVAHQVHFWRAPTFQTDVTALLPDAADTLLEEATDRLLAATAAQWVVLVGSQDWQASKQAAQTVLSVIDPERRWLQSTADGSVSADSLPEPVANARGALASRTSREWLQSATPDQIGRRALQNLLQPVGDGLSSWRDDPLGLQGEWVRERAQWSRLRPREGWLWVEDGDTQWIALPLAGQGAGFAAWNAGENSRLLAEARARVAAQGDTVQVLAAGTVLQAEAAADRAGFEVSLIGSGSLLAVILLTWAVFGSVRPILLVALSLLVGCAAALSITKLVFGQVHLLTMVFGASLIGVAEDYGIHYFASRQGQPVDQRWRQLRQIAPGLWLALATSGVAYMALGLAPFPGLRQIAVFSCAGLAAAFLTVLCWFPWIDRRPIRSTRFARWFARSLDAWPRWPGGWKGWVMAGLVAVILLPGLLRLQSVDDIRALQNVPQALIDEQLQVGRILGLASPAQMFIVSGDGEQALLENEEALTQRLSVLVAGEQISGYLALSDWVPSLATQRQTAAQVAAANRIAWRALAGITGEALPDEIAQPRWLSVDALLAAAGQALPVQAWQDESGQFHSLVMLQGVGRDALPDLDRAARDLPGVRWIDNTARLSQVLAHYRVRLGWLLLAGAMGVVLLLHLRYRAGAWRAWLPTVLGGAATLAFFGWMNIPMQLFVVLSLILLLGMGIDYGIFMQEHPGDRSVWLAVAIAGISTLLAFGLLALSSTPALRAFGLGMLVGETSIWLLTPVFRAGMVRA